MASKKKSRTKNLHQKGVWENSDLLGEEIEQQKTAASKKMEDQEVQKLGGT